MTRVPSAGEDADEVEWDRGHSWAIGTPCRVLSPITLAAAMPIEIAVAARTVAYVTSSMFMSGFPRMAPG
jgi:hypothetical protein